MDPLALILLVLAILFAIATAVLYFRYRRLGNELKKAKAAPPPSRPHPVPVYPGHKGPVNTQLLQDLTAAGVQVQQKPAVTAKCALGHDVPLFARECPKCKAVMNWQQFAPPQPAPPAPSARKQKKFCRHCGSELMKEVKFCNKCGQKVS